MMRIARDLGYTLSELFQKITLEEVQLWSALYQVEIQEQEEALKKAKRK
jgi:hypothetical protein